MSIKCSPFHATEGFFGETEFSLDVALGRRSLCSRKQSESLAVSVVPAGAVGGAACMAAGWGRPVAAAGGWSTEADSADSSPPGSAAAAADHTEIPSEETPTEKQQTSVKPVSDE